MSGSENFSLQKDKVFVFDKDDNVIKEVPYDSLCKEEVYFIVLFTGSFSIYRKTDHFDDEFLSKVKKVEEAENYIKTISI